MAKFRKGQSVIIRIDNFTKLPDKDGALHFKPILDINESTSETQYLLKGMSTWVKERYLSGEGEEEYWIGIAKKEAETKKTDKKNETHRPIQPTKTETIPDNLSGRKDPLAIWAGDLRGRLESYKETALKTIDELAEGYRYNDNHVGDMRFQRGKLEAFELILKHINETV